MYIRPEPLQYELKMATERHLLLWYRRKSSRIDRAEIRDSHKRRQIPKLNKHYRQMIKLSQLPGIAQSAAESKWLLRKVSALNGYPSNHRGAARPHQSPDGEEKEA